MARPLSLLIKPASGRCDLGCRYCFYTGEMRRRERGDRGIMTEETARALIGAALEHGAGECTFAFQGGEPTLAGLDWFRRFVHRAEEENRGRLRLLWSLQTNGTLLDDAWCGFLREKGFLVGLSLDGPRDLHDRYRKDGTGAGSLDRALAAGEMLQRAGVPVNALTVVTARTAKRPETVYAFLRDRGYLWQQYVPCIVPAGEKPEWALTPGAWGEFLVRLFDVWERDRRAGRQVHVRTFESWAALLAGRMPEECGAAGVCSVQYAVEADGEIYPCDFYALDEYRLGNVRDGFDAADARRVELGFLERSVPLPGECRACRWVQLCRGGCYLWRDETGKNRLCGGYRRFFAHGAERLRSQGVTAG